MVKGQRSLEEDMDGRLKLYSSGCEEIKEMNNCLERLGPVGEGDRSMINVSPHGVAKSSDDTLHFPIL